MKNDLVYLGEHREVFLETVIFKMRTEGRVEIFKNLKFSRTQEIFKNLTIFKCYFLRSRVQSKDLKICWRNRLKMNDYNAVFCYN